MLKTVPKTIFGLIASLLLIAGGFVFSAQNIFAAENTAAANHQFVVLLRENDPSILKVIPGLDNIRPLSFAGAYTFESEVSLETLRHVYSGYFEFMDADTVLNIDSHRDNIDNTKDITPNDPGYSKDPLNIDRQWGLHKAGFLKAWEKTTGSRDVIIAVIDTGVDATHDDFEGTRFTPGYNVLTQRNIAKRTNTDDNGHGTLITGVIAATANNEKGIAGAAYGTTIMPIKALDADGTGSSSDISEAIIWAADHEADVINLSLGGMGFAHDTVLANAITYAFNKNVVIVAAAGNDVAVTGGNLDVKPVFPICDDNGQNMIIGVTATDIKDLKPGFANYGKACVDVSAPGRRILSTANHDPSSGALSPDSYAYASGTSLAVPFVSAQAGLLRSLYPGASNRQIRDRIIVTADNIDALNLSQCVGQSCKGLLGGGRINAAKSLEEQIIGIADGDVVQIAGTMDYFLINGGKRQMISPFVRNQRYRYVTPKSVTWSDIQAFPEGSYAIPLDGTLVKSPNETTVYYVMTGLRRPLTYSVFTMRGFRFSDIVTLTNVEINSWVEGSFLAPPDGTLIRSTTNPTVYWVVNGILHPVNYKFYVERGLSIFPVIYSSENDIAKFSKGDPYVL